MTGVAGSRAVAGLLPGQRVGELIITSDSANFTSTRVQIGSLTVTLLPGRYRVHLISGWASSVAGDRVTARLHEDALSGEVRQERNRDIAASFGVAAMPVEVVFEYLAPTLESKTFVISGQRTAGTGNCRLEASTTPTVLSVTYVRPGLD